MNSIKRQTIFTVFAIFFVVLLPFIIILSLGYGIDIKKGSVSNNLTVKIQTFPRNADVLVADKKFQTPAELDITAGQQATLKIEKSDFFAEEFELNSKPNQNSAARIDGLWLLPKNYESDFQINFQTLNILDKNYVLLADDKNYGIANYTFAGVRDEFIKIENVSNLELKKGFWQPLLENIFWEQNQQVILYKVSPTNWKLIDLKTFPHNFTSVVTLNRNQLLLLNDQGNLWSLNLDNQEFNFVENDILGLSFTESPDAVWLLKNDTIYRFARNNFNIFDVDFVNNKFSSSKLILRSSQLVDVKNLNNFVTKNLFLGLVFKIGSEAIYIPDSDKNSYKVIATNVRSMGTTGSTVFWLDGQNDIRTLNLLINQERLIFVTDFEVANSDEVILNYYDSWKRLLIYTKDKVGTVWVDLEINNESIARYKSFLWLSDQNCFGSVTNNYQFCVTDNSMRVYKNNSFPF